MPRSDVVVSVSEVRDLLAGPHPPVLLDVRWRLGEPAGSGQARYAAGHLPGARWVDLETVLTRHTGDPRDGRHPLPDSVTLAAGLVAAGVPIDEVRAGAPAGREIVVYDEGGSFAASRAWWVLGWAGLAVRVLDGGIEAWTAAGVELVADEAAEVPGRVCGASASESDVAGVAGNGKGTGAGASQAAYPAYAPEGPAGVSLGGRATVSADEAAATPARGVLVDVRAPERFRGEVEPLDPVAGHIPGAVNVPVSGLFTAAGALPDEATLRERLAPALDAAAAGRPVVAYCGSGVSAAQAVLALATLGVDAALYPGSWSAWSNDPLRPVARGA